MFVPSNGVTYDHCLGLDVIPTLILGIQADHGSGILNRPYQQVAQSGSG